MSDDFPRKDGESPHDDAMTPRDGDAQTRGREDAEKESGRGDGETGGRGDGDTEKMEEGAFVVSEEGLAESSEASVSSEGEPPAAPPVEQPARKERPANEAPPPAVDRRKAPRGPRPFLSEEREPVYHDEGGYRMRMEPADLAKLRELPGAKGKTDRELGEEFFKGQSARLVASMAEDVETPAEVRVVVDPYSRQAFLAVGRTIRGIVSF